MSAVLISVRDEVATLTLNRPEKLNAFRRQDYDSLIAAIDAAETDPAVRVTVLTGAGRGFCAGTDLSDGFDLPSGGDPATGEGVPPDLGGRVALRLYRCLKPVIAAVNGAAMGFGASLCLPCDFRIASTSARFGFVFARRGISADGCCSWFLPRIVGLPRAADWLLSGRMITAEEAPGHRPCLAPAAICGSAARSLGAGAGSGAELRALVDGAEPQAVVADVCRSLSARGASSGIPRHGGHPDRARPERGRAGFPRETPTPVHGPRRQGGGSGTQPFWCRLILRSIGSFATSQPRRRSSMWRAIHNSAWAASPRAIPSTIWA